MKKTIITFFVSAVMFTIFIGMSSNADKVSNYKLQAPSKTYKLPKILHEISGLTDISVDEIACVQDEEGIIFIYNLTTGEITDRIKFGEDGDYEGITHIDEDIYILRSDGAIIEIKDYKSSSKSAKIIETGITAKDNEGLCYDHNTNQLLIGCKSKVGKGKEFKNLRAIYAFDLTKKKLSKSPFLEITLSDVIDFADKNKIKLPTKTKDKKTKSALKLGISALAVHPQTGDFYILSAVDHMILICDNKGKIKTIEMLDKKLFPQAEGITFMPNGDMLISNEGVNKEPTIFCFNKV